MSFDRKSVAAELLNRLNASPLKSIFPPCGSAMLFWMRRFTRCASSAFSMLTSLVRASGYAVLKNGSATERQLERITRGDDWYKGKLQDITTDRMRWPKA